MDKRFLTVLAVIILGFGGFVWLNKSKAGAPSGSAATGQTTKHLFGSGKKGVTLQEYGDYQCPACFQYYPLVKKLADKYKDDIYLQFSNFPLLSVHRNAFAGARAAEAADKQGKFWEMHDMLYENQDPTGKTGWVADPDPLGTYFKSFATQLSLDMAKFEADYRSEEINNLINADLKAGQNAGADSTPTFVINGKKITNPKDEAGFEKILTDAIASQKQ